MSIDELIDRLKSADGEDRFLELQLAQAIGYRREVESLPNGQRSVLWYLPDGRRAFAREIPKFTSSVDDARALADWASPNHAAAIVVDSLGARAVIDNVEPCAGKTPAIALCIAALALLKAKGIDLE